jgi:hypothetical protein
MSNRDKRVMPIYHDGKIGNKNCWTTSISDSEKYADVVSGKLSLNDKCDYVKIPRPVFDVLIEGEKYLDAADQNLLAILPCNVGDVIYWFNSAIEFGNDLEMIYEGTVSKLVLSTGDTIKVYMTVQEIDGEQILPFCLLGQNEYWYVGLSRDEVELAHQAFINSDEYKEAKVKFEGYMDYREANPNVGTKEEE